MRRYPGCLLIFFIGLINCVGIHARAQLCTGSLGDPVINITFGPGGTSSNFSPPGYTYTNSICPDDGSYTLTSRTSGCFGNAWHTVNSDHTGNGNFMLVNASYQPADFFVATLNGLCPATIYEFSAWVMNVLISPSGIKPNITFTVETPAGTILNQFNTGDVAVSSQPEWKQYGFFFTTTAGNPDIVLRMKNNAPGGQGNDLALDDITFRPCGPVLQAAVQGNDNIINICEGNLADYFFDATVSPGFTLPVFQWQVSADSGRAWRDIAGATGQQYTRTHTGAGYYWYRQTVAESGNDGISSCRIASNIIEINVHPKPAINAGPDRTLIRGRVSIMTAIAAENDLIFNWSPLDNLSDATLLNPSITPQDDITYLLSATSPFGCTNEDRVSIKIVAGIFVPNAFTPNNDGKNDNWTIPYLDPGLGATVQVFNRWGQIVYQTTGAKVEWNGKYKSVTQPAGAYVYYIHFPDGTPGMKGSFVLIR